MFNVCESLKMGFFCVILVQQSHQNCTQFCRDQATRSHLKNVYAALTLSTFAAAGGAAVHIFTDMLKVFLISICWVYCIF